MSAQISQRIMTRTALVPGGGSSPDQVVVAAVRGTHECGRNAENLLESDYSIELVEIQPGWVSLTLGLPHLIVNLIPSKSCQVMVPPGVRSKLMSCFVSLIDQSDHCRVINALVCRRLSIKGIHQRRNHLTVIPISEKKFRLFCERNNARTYTKKVPFAPAAFSWSTMLPSYCQGPSSKVKATVFAFSLISFFVKDMRCKGLQ
jgi:hypothetical protein